MERPVYAVEDEPPVGTRYFGVVDQGTNVVEVRPTSLCPLNCVFCSVAAGPKERRRWCDFTVARPEALAEAVRRIAQHKGVRLEVHIDGMGEPGVYPRLAELVQALREIPQVAVVSMQTRLYFMSERLVEELAEAGVDRLNVSIDAADPDLARRLADSEAYDVRRAMALAEYAAANTRADVTATPVWVPGLNDGEMPALVRWAAGRLGKRWPPILIQNYVPHRRGRRPPGVRSMPWPRFWRGLKELEAHTGIRLDYRGADPFGFTPARPLPRAYRVGERVRVEIRGRGIFRGEYLAVPLRLTGDPLRDRSITVLSPGPLQPGARLTVRIVEARNEIYLARP